MFTGIIEETGVIEQLKRQSEHAIEVTVTAEKVLDDVTLGASIAVNGVCLTVTQFTKKTFTVEVMPETFRTTALSGLKTGAYVNLERALLATDRFGGHFVSGHVDGIGEIIQKEAEENAVHYLIKTSQEILHYVTQQGSVAVDGISLTVFSVDRANLTFGLSIIPHTMAVTALGQKGAGDTVNIECDVLAKHVAHFLQLQNS